MSMRDSLRILRRRWYVLVPGLLVGLVLTVAVFRATPPEFEATASLVVLSPTEVVGQQADGPINPFLNFGGSQDTAAQVLGVRMGDAKVLEELEKNGVKGDWKFEIQGTAGPLSLVTVTESAATGARVDGPHREGGPEAVHRHPAAVRFAPQPARQAERGQQPRRALAVLEEDPKRRRRGRTLRGARRRGGVRRRGCVPEQEAPEGGPGGAQGRRSPPVQRSDRLVDGTQGWCSTRFRRRTLLTGAVGRPGHRRCAGPGRGRQSQLSVQSPTRRRP